MLCYREGNRGSGVAWPCITDFSGLPSYPPTGLRPRRWPPLRSILEHGPLHIYLYACAVRPIWRRWRRSLRGCFMIRKAKCWVCLSRPLSTLCPFMLTICHTGYQYFFQDSSWNSPPTFSAAPYTPKSSRLFSLSGGYFLFLLIYTRWVRKRDTVLLSVSSSNFLLAHSLENLL